MQSLFSHCIADFNNLANILGIKFLLQCWLSSTALSRANQCALHISQATNELLFLSPDSRSHAERAHGSGYRRHQQKLLLATRRKYFPVRATATVQPPLGAGLQCQRISGREGRGSPGRSSHDGWDGGLPSTGAVLQIYRSACSAVPCTF